MVISTFSDSLLSSAFGTPDRFTLGFYHLCPPFQCVQPAINKLYSSNNWVSSLRCLNAMRLDNLSLWCRRALFSMPFGFVTRTKNNYSKKPSSGWSNRHNCYLRKRLEPAQWTFEILVMWSLFGYLRLLKLRGYQTLKAVDKLAVGCFISKVSLCENRQKQQK